MGYAHCAFSKCMSTEMFCIFRQAFLVRKCKGLSSIKCFTLTRITKDDISDIITMNIVDVAWERNGCDVMVALHYVLLFTEYQLQAAIRPPSYLYDYSYDAYYQR